MALINTAWIDWDDHAKALIDSGHWSKVEDTVDNELTADFSERGIDTIPVDLDGYIDNPILRALATSKALWFLMLGKAMVRSNEQQTYMDKAIHYEKEYTKRLSSLVPTQVY